MKKITLQALLICSLISLQFAAYAQVGEGFQVIAHRGASGEAPENTLVAVRRAIELKADMIEIDVHLTKDGELVVIHDHELKRTTDGEGDIKEKTLEEIRKLDAGSWKDPKYAGEKVPTLEEVLLEVKGKANLLIEIKEGEKHYPGIGAKVAEAVKKHDGYDWCIVQSFSQDVLDAIMPIDDKIELHRLIGIGPIPKVPNRDDPEATGKWTRISAINPNYRRAKKRVIKKLHKNGYRIFVWTVNSQETYDKLKARGIDGIITNYPNSLPPASK